ncbi:MAG: AI-2E family transporter [Pontixanthobacter sp.]
MNDASGHSERSEPDADIGNSPTRIDDDRLRFEAQRAFVWALVIGGVLLAVYVSQSLLVLFGALVFAAMLDGGSRLLGRVLPIARMLRIFIILGIIAGLAYWLVVFAGSQISQEAAQLPAIIEAQYWIALDWLKSQGFEIDADSMRGLASNVAGGFGTLTTAIGGLLGGITTLFLIVVIGIYLTVEPRIYERGVAWMIKRDRRDEFFETATRMGYTMRRLMAGRLLGMVFEGLFTWAALALYGVPMAALLGILTGLLAFVPNLGALIGGILMVAVGFSGGVEMGIYTVFIYMAVQILDGYFIIPLIAKKTVDLAPALVLASQLIMGILFGILGLFLADPALAMLKVALERRAEGMDKKLANDGETAAHGP